MSMQEDHDFRRRVRKYDVQQPAFKSYIKESATKVSVESAKKFDIPSGDCDLEDSQFYQRRGYSGSPSRVLSNTAVTGPVEVLAMSFRDRTSELRMCVKSLRLQAQPNGTAGHKPGKKILNETLQFNQHAKQIGQELSKTCAKLEQLSQLAQRKSLFDDPAAEIESLALRIRMDISSLNKKIAQLQELTAAPRSSVIKKHAHTHSTTVVVSLQSKLACVSNEFKQVLEMRTENLKLQKTRRDRFSRPQTASSALPSSTEQHVGSVLFADDLAASNGSDVAISMDNLSSERERYQQQLQLIDEQDSYIESRANAMANIESTIVELGTIFQQLAHMVQEQGEMVTRIDSNVEETSLHIEAAHVELLRYFRSVSQNRWLILKVFGVLFVFFIIFITFMV